MKGGPGTSSPGRVTWQKAWLGDLVATAFRVEPENVSGPGWISGNGAQLYMFTAVMPPDTSRHDFELMFQRFLIDQFKMQLHHDTRMFPGYELVVAPAGAKLKASADQSADPNAPVLLTGPPKIDPDGFPSLPPGHGVVLRFDHGGYYATFQDYTLPQLAEFLKSRVTLPGSHNGYVMDKTGLTGLYDLKLKFDEGNNNIEVGPAVLAAGAIQGTEPSGLPNIFKAVEQQLGLKLVKTADIPKDTIVIDHAERIPTGN
jgi:uncharacterized protein (TIGR03435 family)